MSAISSGPAGPGVRLLLLPEAIRTQITAEVQAAAPEECCGLLTGRVEGAAASVTGVRPSPNRAADRRAFFEIDTALLFAVQRAAREGGETVLGHYHSHPRGPAGPSETDRARAWGPGHVWLICAPDTDGRTHITAHLAVAEADGVLLRPLDVAAP